MLAPGVDGKLQTGAEALAVTAGLINAGRNGSRRRLQPVKANGNQGDGNPGRFPGGIIKCRVKTPISSGRTVIRSRHLKLSGGHLTAVETNDGSVIGQGVAGPILQQAGQVVNATAESAR